MRMINSQTRRYFHVAVVVGIVLMVFTTWAWAKDKKDKPAIDPKADELLKRTSDYLAEAKYFSFSAEMWQDDNLMNGQRVQAGRNLDVQIRRPNRWHSELRSTRHSRGIFYNGKTLTLFNRVQNFFGETKVPGTIDEALDYATDRLGMVLPLEDLLVSDPYKNFTKDIISGRYIGPVTVLGVPCEHLAFSEANIDWQIWIEAGPRPVPRKLVITYKDEDNSPEFTAIITAWDFQTKLSDFVFEFEPPASAQKIPIQEVKALKEKEIRR
ncbi:DUF2092 domain-containing protein [Pedosphaera parvula]|uniref:DUF2092 domain-containing protein n=1 Tax=Pedosphaera parvula (strain Ellin514) TaxID=320771 RepID=B9XSW1_PEDPL|nr:DUF2092 domain-containing protein [Pedosphaera parvula]EEF57070.1 conserved hypothetical protein [Pedosphaera parvula Ellin514]